MRSIVTWAGWISILPFASVTITSLGYWTNNAQKIRFSRLIVYPVFLVYDALIHFGGGVFIAPFTLTPY